MPLTLQNARDAIRSAHATGWIDNALLDAVVTRYSQKKQFLKVFLFRSLKCRNFKLFFNQTDDGCSLQRYICCS